MELLLKYGCELRKIVLPAEAPVSELMAVVSETLGVPPENQKLIFRGKILATPHASVTSFGVKDSANILVINSAPAPELPKAAPAPASIPTPLIDGPTRHPRSRTDEYMTVDPHSGIIAKGPPEGGLSGNNYQLSKMPHEALVVRDSEGDVARLAFRSEDVVVDSERNHHRLFYQEITSYCIQELPGYEQQYIALCLQIRGQKLWVYFIPKQFRNIIESVVLQRPV